MIFYQMFHVQEILLYLEEVWTNHLKIQTPKQNKTETLLNKAYTE